MRPSRTIVITTVVAVAAVAAVAGGIAAFASADTPGLSGEQRRIIRDATKQYRDIDIAATT